MSTWRRKAIEFLPSERTLIQFADNPMELWLELVTLFAHAFRECDKNKIRKILDYAVWCCSNKSGALPNHTSTAAIIGFYESIAPHKEYWSNFRSWFLPSEFEKYKDNFGYHLNSKELFELNAVYYETNA